MNKEYERPEAHDEIPAKISELISLAESAELSKAHFALGVQYFTAENLDTFAKTHLSSDTGLW